MNAHRLRQLWQGISSRRRAFFYRLLGMKITGRVWLERIEWPARPACVSLGDGAALDRSVTLLATNDAVRIEIGPRTYINRHTMLDAAERIEICEQAMIGPFCYITDHDHAFGTGLAPGETPLVAKPVRIGSRCWLGAHVSILKGVSIGDGTVVGAGSVVTKSLPANVVAAGNPARVFREIGREPGK